ncbi:MAG: AzlD domain-containing protein [Firmicutes bacterium HGW-Firmicutes-1]|jgi:branched-subunit amino acid transport protein|nr:MAG: AzlD domain-containing protein [Firmicutes bacterium HGW-Firmicutes-1]
MKSYLPLILGMMAVTYIPRLLPLITLSERPLHPKIKKFLLYIPYTALSALIVRGIMQSGNHDLLISIVGLGVAGVVAWFKGGMVLSVIAAIVATFIMLTIR